MGENANRSMKLFELLKDGPIFGTVELIGDKCGCPSMPSSQKFFQWVRVHDVGYVLPYLSMGPNPQWIGIWYRGMSKQYAYQMDVLGRAMVAQTVAPRLANYRRCRSMNPGQIVYPTDDMVSTVQELIDELA